MVPPPQVTLVQAEPLWHDRAVSAQVPASEPAGHAQIWPLVQAEPLHLQTPSAGSQLVLPRHVTPAQRLSTQVREPSPATEHVWPLPHTVLPHMHRPVFASQLWFRLQATCEQSTFGWQTLLAGLHTCSAPHAVPPVPPHLHLPSTTSQLVPGCEQVTPAQRVDRQVFDVSSQAKPSAQATPP